MVKYILQQLLEHQAYVSSGYLSIRLKQPLTVIEQELKALDNRYPGLLSLRYVPGKQELQVSIGEFGKEQAQQLLATL